MNFSEIIIKNFQKNISYYALYLFSLIISVILFFSFVTVQDVKNININQSYAVIRDTTHTGSLFLFIIITIFIIYSNLLFLKRRFKEFGLYQIIGLNKRHLVQIVAIEQAIIYTITLLLGILIGLFSTKILLMIVLKLLGARESVPIVFSLDAVIQTLILIAIAFIITIVQSVIMIYIRSLHDFLYQNDTDKAIDNKINYKEIILGISGIGMVITGYYITIVHINDYITTFVLFAVFALFLLGPYLFFRSTVSLIFKIIKKLKRGTVDVNDVMFTSSLIQNVRKNAFSLTIMSILSAITLSVLCIAAISRSTLTNEVLIASPFDVTVQNSNTANQLANQLNAQQIPYRYNYKELIYTHLYNDRLFNKKEYNSSKVNVTSETFFKHVSLDKGEAKLIIPEGTSDSGMFINSNSDGKTSLGKKSNHINVRLTSITSRVYFKDEIDNRRPTFILNEQDYRVLKSESKNKNVISQYGFNLKHKKDISKLESITSEMKPKVEARSQIVSEVSSMTGIVLFVSSFLGITFLIAQGCIIYIRQIDETENELNNYAILRKLGFSQKDMAKGLKLKVIFNFVLPLSIALFHAYFTSIAFMKMLGNTNQIPIYIVMIVYSAIYILFAAIAYSHSKRTINHSI